VWKLAQSPHVTQMWCAPGNAGIQQEQTEKTKRPVECVNIGAENLPGLLAFAQEKKPDLTVVGPDNPLALGIVDLFQQNGLQIWGPTGSGRNSSRPKFFPSGSWRNMASRLRLPELSPTQMRRKSSRNAGGRCAVKADGLALGKGVLLTTNLAEAEKAIDEIMVGKVFGAAGTKIVIQEFLEGAEDFFARAVRRQNGQAVPASQDHKRALDGDQGLNTGGMGAYSPVAVFERRAACGGWKTNSRSWLKGCAAEGIDFSRHQFQRVR